MIQDQGNWPGHRGDRGQQPGHHGGQDRDPGPGQGLEQARVDRLDPVQGPGEVRSRSTRARRATIPGRGGGGWSLDATRRKDSPAGNRRSPSRISPAPGSPLNSTRKGKLECLHCSTPKFSTRPGPHPAGLTGKGLLPAWDHPAGNGSTRGPVLQRLRSGETGRCAGVGDAWTRASAGVAVLGAAGVAVAGGVSLAEAT
jgi:hypothetical protein